MNHRSFSFLTFLVVLFSAALFAAPTAAKSYGDLSSSRDLSSDPFEATYEGDINGESQEEGRNLRGRSRWGGSKKKLARQARFAKKKKLARQAKLRRSRAKALARRNKLLKARKKKNEKKNNKAHGKHKFGPSKGLIVKKSTLSVDATQRKFTKMLEGLADKGLKLFGVVEHDKGAATAGFDLKPTRVVIFGNPNLGTPLMKCVQRIAIDLPQKLLIWEDPKGETKIAYNNPQFLKHRHNLGKCGHKALKAMSEALDGLTNNLIKA